MKLAIKNNALYVENLFFCYVEIINGKPLQPGHYAAETRYSHHHGEDLPHVESVGWIGPATHRNDTPCALILGRIRGRSNVLPCPSFVIRLLAMLNEAEDRGEPTTLVVE